MARVRLPVVANKARVGIGVSHYKPGLMRRRARGAEGLHTHHRPRKFSAWPKSGLGRLRKCLRVLLMLLLAFMGLSALLVLSLRWIDPPVTAFMLQDESGRRPIAHQWVSRPKLGIEVGLAVIAAEDQRFAIHRGFDIEAIQSALAERKAGRRLRGASTLTQQVAKNLFLWPGRSLLRKGLEAWTTGLLELFLSKSRILELYLNIAEFGPGIYGVGAASAEFFAREPKLLSTEQAALLAAVLPSPKRLRVDRPSDYVRERQRWIGAQMQALRSGKAIRALTDG